MTTLQHLLSARYGTLTPQLGENADALLNPTLTTLLEHHSVRKFLDTPVSDDHLSLIVAAAQSASTSSSLQSWSVIVVRDLEKRSRIAAGCGNSKGFIEAAPVFLVWVIDFARAGNILADADVHTNTFDLIENTAVGFVDVGIASENALVAAESLGLGGVYAGSLRNDIPTVAETLNLPKYVFPAVGLAIGHPDPTEGTSVKPRLPQRAVVHTDEYDPELWRDSTQAYDHEFGAYYAAQGHKDARWSRTVVNRLGDPDVIGGRVHLRAHLEAQGLDSK